MEKRKRKKLRFLYKTKGQILGHQQNIFILFINI